jgi:ABC-type antimicrobial peptide transport system permease subunit
MFDSLINDMRCAIRTLSARSGFFASVVLSPASSAGVSPVYRHVMGDGAVQIGSRMALGVLGAAALGLLLRNQPFAVGSIDLLGLAAVVVVMGAIAWVACWLPARRAAATDPIVGLRNE